MISPTQLCWRYHCLPLRQRLRYQSFQALDADKCFEKSPRTAISLEIAAYYYAIQIYCRLDSDSTPELKPVYTQDPSHVLRQVGEEGYYILYMIIWSILHIDGLVQDCSISSVLAIDKRYHYNQFQLFKKNVWYCFKLFSLIVLSHFLI